MAAKKLFVSFSMFQCFADVKAATDFVGSLSPGGGGAGLVRSTEDALDQYF